MKNNQINFKFRSLRFAGEAGISNFKLFFVYFIYLLICLFVYSGNVNAQQISLSIYPPLLEATIKPGKSILIAYRVENLGDPTILKAKVLPFSPKNNSGDIIIKDQFEGPIEFSLDNANLALNQSVFLKTNDSQQFLLRISVPDNTLDGDYYYSLLAETQPPPTVEGTLSSRSKASVGSNILITVTGSGKIDINGRIALFDVLPHYKLNLFGRIIDMFDSNDKVPVSLIVENRGANLIKPNGQIVLKGNFAETAHFEILPQNILSRSQRLLSATPSAKIECTPNSKEKACMENSTLLLSGFFLGRYLLSTNLNFAEATTNLYAATSFYALPFKFISALLMGIIVSIIIWKRIREHNDISTKL